MFPLETTETRLCNKFVVANVAKPRPCEFCGGFPERKLVRLIRSVPLGREMWLCDDHLPEFDELFPSATTEIAGKALEVAARNLGGEVWSTDGGNVAWWMQPGMPQSRSLPEPERT